MTANLLELAGFFLVVIGMGLVVGAAARISTALAVLAAGVFVLFLGCAVVMVANQRSRATT